MTINEAIENLEDRKAFMMNTCPQCWDPAIDLALDGLKVIEKYTDLLGESIAESRDIYATSKDFDDLVDCENVTRLNTYCECSKLLHDLKWQIMDI
jgi:hypothetical protein